MNRQNLSIAKLPEKKLSQHIRTAMPIIGVAEVFAQTGKSSSLLSDTRLSALQRQSIASEMGMAHGNQYLNMALGMAKTNRVIASSSYLIQRSEETYVTHDPLGCSIDRGDLNTFPETAASNREIPNIQRHQNHSRLTAQQRYEHTLAHAGTTRQKWEAALDRNAKFLGVPISRGIHQELINRLNLAAGYLRTQFPGQNDQAIAQTIGIYSISGLRPPRNSAAGSRVTNHAYGIAIDVNYLGNPFLGQTNSVTFQIIKRATSLVLGREINMSGEQSGSAEEIRSRYESASNAFRIYFSLQNDPKKLEQLLIARARPTDPQSVLRELNLIRRDCSNRALLADFATDNPRNPRNPALGFMDLKRELIEALVVHGGLFWGGQYRGGKDLMHFDWRSGTIQENHRL